MKILLIIIIASFFNFGNGISAEMVFIVHKDCAQDTITKRELKDMYLAKKSSWSDGTKVILFMQSKGTHHESFARDYIKKSPSQFKAFWKKRVFTGKGSMPGDYKTDTEMIKAVSEQAGSIGYVDKLSLEGVESVKVITVK